MTSTSTWGRLVPAVMVLVVLIILAASSGGRAQQLQFVERTVIVAGPYEGQSVVTQLDSAYQYSTNPVQLTYSPAYGLQTAVGLYAEGRADVLLLPSRLAGDNGAYDDPAAAVYADVDGWVQIPLALYGMVVVYNYDLTAYYGITLDQNTLALVWNGTLATWDALVSLVEYGSGSGNITLVVQQFDSPVDEFVSSTGVFGRYLASIDPEGFAPVYRRCNGSLACAVAYLNPGRTHVVPWPASGSLLSTVKTVAGSISYALWEDASSLQPGDTGVVSWANMLNQVGDFVVSPTVNGLQVALQDFQNQISLQRGGQGIDAVNPYSTTAWPITGIIYATLPSSASVADCSYLATLLQLLSWSQTNAAFSNSEGTAVPTAPLTLGFSHSALDVISSVTCDGSQASDYHVVIGGGRASLSTTLLAEAFDPTSSALAVKFIQLSQSAVSTNIQNQDIDFGVLESAEFDLQVLSNITAVPFAVSAIVPTYNVPELVGLSSGGKLFFSPATIASILLNQTRCWNDSAIVADNPSFASVLPFQRIIFVLDAGGDLEYSGGPSGGLINQILVRYLSSMIDGFNETVSKKGGGIVYPIQSDPSGCILAGSYSSNGVSVVSSVVTQKAHSLGFDVLTTVLESRTLPVGGMIVNNDRILPDSYSIAAAASPALPTSKTYNKRSTGNNVISGSSPSWPMIYWMHTALLSSDSSSACSTVSNTLQWLYWTQANSSSAHNAIAQDGIVLTGSLSDSWIQQTALILSKITCKGSLAFMTIPCLNAQGQECSSAGSCVVSLTTSAPGYCACQDNYYGPTCEYVKSDSSSNTVGLALGLGLGLGGGLLLLLLLLMLIIVPIIACVVLKRRNQNNAAWEIDPKEIDIGDELGSGGNGTVYKAKWRGTEVAVKFFNMENAGMSRESLAQFRHEIELTSSIRHPNVVQFLAASTRLPKLCLVMELMPLGSLYDLLGNDLITVLPFMWRMRAITNLCKGMLFLHQSNIVHRDLKSSNVLLGKQWDVKVADFGLSGISYGKSDRANQISVPWAAPEILNETAGSEPTASDVYSFAIVMWEVITRRRPFEDMSRAAIAVAVIREDARPSMPDGDDPLVLLDSQDQVFAEQLSQLISLMRNCWLREPADRPTFGDIKLQLDSINDELAKLQGFSNSSCTEDQLSTTRASNAGNSSTSYPSASVRNWSIKTAGPVASLGSAPEGNVCIVFSDLPCMDLIWDADPEEARKATLTYNEIVRTGLAKHSGYESLLPYRQGSQSSGVGSFCLVFRDFNSAIGFCADIQRSLLEAEWSQELLKIDGAHIEYADARDDLLIYKGLRARMGISYGPCRRILDERTRRITYAGPTVDLAAYLCLLGDGGQVLVSRSIADQLRDAASEPKQLKELGVAEMRLLKVVKPDVRDMGDERGSLGLLIVHGLEGRAREIVRWTVRDSSINDDHESSGESMHPADDPDRVIELTEQIEADRPSLKTLASANNGRWLISLSDVRVGKRIGKGSTATVHQGEWKNTPVAVKLFNKATLNEEVALECRAEIALLARLNHPNVVVFVGAHLSRDRFAVVTELMSNGSLYDVLHNKVKHPLTWTEKLRMALDVTSGLRYLHSQQPPIIHRDLKSSNLLVDEYLTVKVSDFGFSRVKQDNETMTRCGTPAWTAPEVIRNVRYDEKADVYSLGIVLWEILTRKTPFANCNLMRVAMEVVNGKRPELPTDCPPDYGSLIKRCWHDDPAKRPTVDQVGQVLRTMLGDDNAAPFLV